MQYPENMVSTHQEGLQRVKKVDKYIYIAELSGVTAVAYNDCIYALGKEEFFPSSYGWVFPENSLLLSAFNEK